MLKHQFFASCAKLLEGLLCQELALLGATDIKATVAGAKFTGSLAVAYRVCLWSRVANLVLYPLSTLTAKDADQLYQQAQKIDWSLHIKPTGTFCIQVVGESSFFTNTMFIGQRIKDAIADQFREKFQVRPSVVTNRPEVMVHVYCHLAEMSLSINLAGESLHKRGYRLEAGRAPLKETLAAAILYRANWPARALQPSPVFYDPMCGAGTLLIEAALMAFDIAPGLMRTYFGFSGWLLHEPTTWDLLQTEATARKTEGLKRSVMLLASDSEDIAITKCRENAKCSGLLDRLVIFKKDARELEIPQSLRNSASFGLLVFNPPYGERMPESEVEDLKDLYAAVGRALSKNFVGWCACVFSGAPKAVVQAIGLRASRLYAFLNGQIPCQLFHFEISPERVFRHETPEQKLIRQVELSLKQGLSESAKMLENRLIKNLNHLKKWAKREGVTCYRLYDVDLPNYAAAVDVYEHQFAHVQEYQAPQEIDPKAAHRRMVELVGVLSDVLKISLENIFLKVRHSQGEGQYQKLSDSGQFFKIQEGPASFWVNFTDYLDTGIFLDHRYVRRHLATLAKGHRVLNLFSYTATAGIQAALGGAACVVNIDMSNTYNSWAQKNAKLNLIPLDQMRFIQADCFAWLSENPDQFEVIFLNPPTFSNSKRMNASFEVQRDHVQLIHETMRHLLPGGVLLFSCNLRNFKLNSIDLCAFDIKDISRKTLSPDFDRKSTTHHVFELRFSENPEVII